MYNDDNIFEVALWLYNNGVNEWNTFTDDELKELWTACLITEANPDGQAYDDEVYNEMDKRGLFATA